MIPLDIVLLDAKAYALYAAARDGVDYNVYYTTTTVYVRRYDMEVPEGALLYATVHPDHTIEYYE